MAESTWTFSQTFSTKFQSTRSDLEKRVNTAKSSSPSQELLRSLTIDLAKLTRGLADATGSLPGYDQKQYEIQVKALEKDLENLRASSAPKSKFSFKKKQAAVSIPAPVAVEPRVTLEQSIVAPSKNLEISSHAYTYLTTDSVSGPPEQSELTISDLDHCIVDLLPRASVSDSGSGDIPHNLSPRVSALHIQNLIDTVLILPEINGSVLLHDLIRCVVVVGCHQFRMHTSQKVDVFLSISSNPIIEHCKDIRFSQYPQQLSSSGMGDKPAKELYVQDFSHIRSTPSPHWTLLGDESQDRKWPVEWIRGRGNLEHTLSMLLPASPSLNS
ncbi:tubulin binding cofactor C-domain-containing protein [Crucibulum laeve]|uniref:Tubulin binding cofactor C-domain-containing protein n=1 Tax=Crucibulum laeve TaxID=68775 RepID=A0A5C3LFM1_9AGAR|nr:tubulin binding cofactor C-domain-containing protein [Crucibulum laeve]